MSRRVWAGVLWAAWVALSAIFLVFYDSPPRLGWLVVLFTAIAGKVFGPPWALFRTRSGEGNDDANAVEGRPLG